MPPPIWKNPIDESRVVSVYQSASHVMYSMPLFVVPGTTSPEMQCAAKMLPNVLSSHPGTTIGKFFSAAATIQLSLGSIS